MVTRMAGDVFADLDDFQRQIQQLLGLASRANSNIRSVAVGTFPALNVGNTPEATEVFAFAPGIDPASIDVSIDKGVLTIAGERRPTTANGEAGKQTVYASERSQGAFRRVVSLPDDADPTQVEASYSNGVLRVRIQKRETSRPRRIEIA